MLGLIATLVFATAGGASTAVIASSLRQALPALRRLAAERGSLAEDRAYLITLIETPRHDGTPAPQVAAAQVAQAASAPARALVVNPARRRMAGMRGPLRAAA
jgi:hypothetical protein